MKFPFQGVQSRFPADAFVSVWSGRLIIAVWLALVSACGGTKMLREPVPLQLDQPLASASDENIRVDLDWVIVRDSAGSWARKADWDEYLIRVHNLSVMPVIIRDIAVYDSTGHRVESASSREKLASDSKEIVRRYQDEGVGIEFGHGSTVMVLAGGVLTAGGWAAAEGAAAASVLGGGSSTGVAFASGLLLVGPVLIVAGTARFVNGRRVNREIKRRQTELPVVLQTLEGINLDRFFPIAPSPRSLQVIYDKADREHNLDLDLHIVLDGLHIGEGEASKPPRGGHRGQHRIF